MLSNKNKGNQSSSCHFNIFVLQSQGFSKHIKKKNWKLPQHWNIYGDWKWLYFPSFFLMCQDGWLEFSQDSWLNSSFTGRNCSWAGIGSEAGRQGVGQEKLERANSARELQQSLHKRGGLCNACGFVLRNLGWAKHIQMCQTGQKPIQTLIHT